MWQSMKEWCKMSQIYDKSQEIGTGKVFGNSHQNQSLSNAVEKSSLPTEVESFSSKLNRFLNNKDDVISGNTFSSIPRKFSLENSQLILKVFNSMIQKNLQYNPNEKIA